jgi:hypothetical protein
VASRSVTEFPTFAKLMRSPVPLGVVPRHDAAPSECHPRNM